MSKDSDGLDFCGADEIGGLSYEELKKRKAAFDALPPEEQNKERQKGWAAITDMPSGSAAAAATGTMAAKHCGALNMTLWHYLFFLALFVVIFFAPQVFSYLTRTLFSSRRKPIVKIIVPKVKT